MISTGALFISAISMGGIGLLLAICLVVADKKFHVEVDEKLERIQDALPGINCGACGFPGCNGLAASIFTRESAVNACPVGGAEAADMIADIMGVAPEAIDVGNAVVLCHGGNKEAIDSKEYYGDKTCSAAHLTGGGKKACTYGCLGYGDCVGICPFGALIINDNGLAEVKMSNCTGCGKCVSECPRGLIELVPEKARVFVYCNSRDKGGVCKKMCSVSCIGCGLCAKECKFDAITIENNLAVVDFKKCKNCAICAKKCPTGAIGVIPK